MTPRTIVWRSLTFFWRTNVAVVAGVATAVAVLAGALVVGTSVRGTLRDLAVARLGAADAAVLSGSFFREALVTDVQADPAFAEAFSGIVPVIAFEGFVTAQTTGRRAGAVRVYGVDDRFWAFHHVNRAGGLQPRQAFVSPALAEETGAGAGMPLLVRVQLPSDIPLESIHGRKDDPGRTIRATVQAVLRTDELGEFTLSPEQGRIRAVFLPLSRVQQELNLAGRINTLLVSARAGPDGAAGRLSPILRRALHVEDAGLTVRALDVSGTLVLGSDAGLIDDRRVAAATRAAEARGLRVEPIFTYLANTIRIGTREMPYALIAARDLNRLLPSGFTDARPPIVLNAWAARDLGARIGDPVTLDYYVWEEPGSLVTKNATFHLAGIVPVEAGDRDLAPTFPGISDSPTLDDWDPPFPIDLGRVRPVDEDYWTRYRTTPKAFIGIEEGQSLWRSPYGAVTSLRLSLADAEAGRSIADELPPFVAALKSQLDPEAAGMLVRNVRSDALAASTGATDFAQYFVYFSFFLVVSALVLAALFFKLGVEQRVREVGLLRAVGARPATTRRLFMAEALALSIVGSIIGVAGAVGYAATIVHLLRTRWVGAVGTTALNLHVSPGALAIGAFGGVAAALVCTWIALRGLQAVSERALLMGELSRDAIPDVARETQPGRWLGAAVAGLLVAAILIAGGLFQVVAPAGSFFGAAFVMLLSGLALVVYLFRRPRRSVLQGRGWWAVSRLGLRNTAARPMRSALSITVVAAATFILIAVDAFRKDTIADVGPSSGLGGYSIVADSLLPIAHDLATPAGRQALGLTDLDDVRFEPFRLRPGDDASCLNLYRPTNPRILGVTESFIGRGRFAFRGSMADTDVERANPWLLLERTFDDGAVPVIADANSLAYVLHTAVGQDIVIDNGGRAVRLRVVAALSDSLFQREVLMAEAPFRRLFPHDEGYRFLLAETAARRTADVSLALEEQLNAFGVDATTAADRLASFHQVENTYLTTFQTLGGLGLGLGTVGLAAVLLRNVVERRRELALLGAVGYERRHLRLMLLAESLSLLFAGLAIGGAAAAVASVPALVERGGRLPLSASGLALIGAVLAAGVIATSLAARAASRGPLLDALRSE